MKKKTIVYFSPDFFFDVDMPVLPYINEKYNLIWVNYFTKNARFTGSQITEFCQREKIKNKQFVTKHRRRSLAQFSLCLRIIRFIRKVNPDIIYMEYLQDPYIFMLTKFFLPRDKIIAAIHDVKSHSNFSNKVQDLLDKWILGNFVHYQFFSNYQTHLFLSKYKGNTFTIPLAPKDCGRATNGRPQIEEKCKFLFFGGILSYKQLDVLIKACERLYDKGIKNFSLTIAGKGNYWEYCKTFISHPDIFNCEIRFIPNDEIPDLMNSHHFLVLPYKDATQSGPLMNAYQYNLPVMVTNIPGLTEFVIDGKIGIIAQQNGEIGLEKALVRCIKMTNKQYDSLVDNLKCYISKHLSLQIIQDKYCQMFDSL